QDLTHRTMDLPHGWTWSLNSPLSLAGRISWESQSRLATLKTTSLVLYFSTTGRHATFSNGNTFHLGPSWARTSHHRCRPGWLHSMLWNHFVRLDRRRFPMFCHISRRKVKIISTSHWKDF